MILILIAIPADAMICKDMFCIHIHCHSRWCKPFEWIRIEWIRTGGIRVERIRIVGYVLVGYVCHSCWCKPFEWIRIEWIRIAWIRIGGIRVERIRIGGIRFEWICVGYVWCDGYVWDMCGVRYANNLLKNPATKRLSGKKRQVHITEGSTKPAMPPGQMVKPPDMSNQTQVITRYWEQRHDNKFWLAGTEYPTATVGIKGLRTSNKMQDTSHCFCQMQDVRCKGQDVRCKTHFL